MRRLASAPLALVLALCAGLPAWARSRGQDALERGAQLYKEHRFADAAAAFREATRLDPGLLSAWENLGWAHHRSGRHREAVSTWRTLLKVEPRRVELLNEIGAIELSAGRWDSAFEALLRSLELHPDQPAIRLRLAGAYDKAGRRSEAESAYRELARLRPDDLAATLRVAEFLERSGQIDAALAFLEPASAHLPRYAHILDLRVARLYARRADAAYRRGDHRSAAEAYGRAVQLDPRRAAYLVNLGWARRGLGELAEAAGAWRQALSLEPGRSSLYRHIGDAELEQQDLGEAAEMYTQAWSEAERQPGVAYHLAEIALEEGRSDDGVLWLEELFALPGADAEWSRRVAGLFTRVEQATAGVEFFERRLPRSARPEDTRAALAGLRAARGSAAQRAGDGPAALRELQAAVELDPRNVPALRDLGWAHWAREDWKAAAEVWLRYADKYPERAEPQSLLAGLRLKVKDYPGAVAAARSSLALEPDQPREQLKLARALVGARQFAEARALAEKLAEKHPHDTAIQLHWADTLMQYHDFARGQPQWRRLLELGVRSPRAEYYLVLSMYELGEYDAAIAEARRRLAETGEANQPLLQFLAGEAQSRGRLDDAAYWYERLTRHFPEKAAVWLELARLHSLRGDPDAGRAVLEQARARHPGRLDVELALAQVQRRTGQLPAAYAAFQSLHERYPHQREVFLARVETALESGRASEALAALQGDPTGFLKEYEGELLAARVRFAMGDERAARLALTPIVEPAAGTHYVPVLLYHGLGEHERSQSMPVALFDSQMQVLKSTGYTPITLRELGQALDGQRALPERPILITFDDARLDSFRLATPVLEKHGFRATMFVPTARIVDAHPFFADWQAIAGFAGGGRWDLQSHGHEAHDPIALDGEQQLGSFLVNRAFLSDEGRLESFEEYQARLDADYRQSREEIASRFPGGPPSAYAFPFSEAGQEQAGNEPRAAETNSELVARHFRFGLVQDESGYNQLSRANPPRLLRRLAVPRDWDGAALARHLARSHPAALALALRARQQYWSGRYDGSQRDFERLARQQPDLEGEAAYYLAAISEQRGRYDVARRYLETAERLRAEPLRDDPRLLRRVSWQSRARLQPHAEVASDSDGRQSLVQGADLRLPVLGPLELSLGAATVSLRQDGHATLRGDEFAAGGRLRAAEHWSLEARTVYSALEGGARDTWSSRGQLGFEGDRLSVAAHVGREDVPTARARELALQADSFGGRARLRLSPRWQAALEGVQARFDDGNRRSDLSGRLLFSPRRLRSLGLGVAAGRSDTLFQSERYYSPEELTWVRGLVSHRVRWGSGWAFESEAGLGLADDALRGRRRTGHFSTRAEQVWGPRVRTRFEGRYSSSPGYRGWGFEAVGQLGF